MTCFSNNLFYVKNPQYWKNYYKIITEFVYWWYCCLIMLNFLLILSNLSVGWQENSSSRITKKTQLTFKTATRYHWTYFILCPFKVSAIEFVVKAKFIFLTNNFHWNLKIFLSYLRIIYRVFQYLLVSIMYWV